MDLIADTHVHFYPSYDPDRFWGAVRTNLQRAAERAGVAGPCHKAIYLTERHDCHAFEDWCGSPDAASTSEPWCLTMAADGAEPVHVVAGRQVATAERLEVLALATTASFEDGLSLAESLAAVREAGGVPVLPWAPGKWFGARGQMVSKIAGEQRADVLLGDSSTRPVGWPEPSILAQYRRAGGRVIAGSDPYPYAGQERVAGRYASLWSGLDDAVPVETQCRSVLDVSPSAIAGSRKGPIAWGLSMWRCARA